MTATEICIFTVLVFAPNLYLTKLRSCTPTFLPCYRGLEPTSVRTCSIIPRLVDITWREVSRTTKPQITWIKVSSFTSLDFVNSGRAYARMQVGRRRLSAQADLHDLGLLSISPCEQLKLLPAGRNCSDPAAPPLKAMYSVYTSVL